MKIIVEGPDGAGKSTLVRQLADHFGCDILRMTEKGSKRFEDYIEKASLNNIVSDRCFISELVYCNVFNRQTPLSIFQYEELVKYYKSLGWIFIFLDASTDCLTSRLINRGDEDDYKIQDISSLRMFYKAVAYFYSLPVLNSENLDVNQLIEDLEEGIYGKCDRK